MNDAEDTCRPETVIREQNLERGRRISEGHGSAEALRGYRILLRKLVD